jgi:hypothetical protein
MDESSRCCRPIQTSSARRVAKLCLPLGGWQFWSRRAYDLAYQSQREQRHERTLRKLQSIRAGLAGLETRI